LAVVAGYDRASRRAKIGMLSVTVSFQMYAKFMELVDSNAAEFMVAATGNNATIGSWAMGPP
jgi:hypothetical protein